MLSPGTEIGDSDSQEALFSEMVHLLFLIEHVIRPCLLHQRTQEDDPQQACFLANPDSNAIARRVGC